MLKTFVLLAACIGILATGVAEVFSSRLLHKTTTEQPEELLAATTTVETATSSHPLPTAYYKSNNLPEVEKGCEIRFLCRKKLKTAEIPRPCTKFCVNSIKCANNKNIRGVPGQCLELNEEMVAQEYNDCKMDDDDAILPIMHLAIIDFACQPGYLPDSCGRCRELR